MDLVQAKETFINAWGSLGSSWGINKVMGQIHALLLVSTEPLSTDQIMEELHISRGNVNMNIRALMDWGIAEKVYVKGERKEYFTSKKDIMELARQVTRERRKRELEPILKVLDQVQQLDDDSKEAKEFKKVTKELTLFSKKADTVLEKFAKSDKNWFFKMILKL